MSNELVSTRDFLEAFGLHEIHYRVLKGFGHKHRGNYKTDNINELGSNLDLLNILNVDFKKDIFFIPNEGGSCASEIIRVTAQWADFDIGRIQGGNKHGSYKSLEEVAVWKIEWWAKLDELVADGIIPEPSIIVDTRNGLHVYWLYSIDNEYDLDNFTPIQKSIIARLGSDPTIHDLPRLMRLPNMLWQKYGEGCDPYTIRVVQFQPDLRYTMNEMLEFFPVEAEWVEEAKKKRASAALYKGGGLASAGTWYVQFTGKPGVICIEGFREGSQIHAACPFCTDAKGHDIVITPFSGGHRAYCNGDMTDHYGGFASQDMDDLFVVERVKAWARIKKARSECDFTQIQHNDISRIQDYLNYKNSDLTPQQYIERDKDKVITGMGGEV